MSKDQNVNINLQELVDAIQIAQEEADKYNNLVSVLAKSFVILNSIYQNQQKSQEQESNDEKSISLPVDTPG